MPFLHTAEPITDDDATIERALEHAAVGALLPALAFATGDRSILRDDLRPDPNALSLPGAPPTAEELAGRVLALDVLRRFRDGGSVPAPPPGAEDLTAMIHFATGGAAVDDYLPLFREELGIDGEDGRAPGWRLEDVAPGRDVHVVVIGAGMSGLVAAHRLRQAGVRVTVVEKNDDVGGTWLENSYPGCRVDVTNHFYSYSFAQRDDWPQHYSSQAVLLDYFRRCADDFGLRDVIRFRSEVVSAEWDEAAARWRVRVRRVDAEDIDDEVLEADLVVSAVGQLNRPLVPELAGHERFGGAAFHSARWDHDVDLAGRRVAVIGTGASAMQLIPAIAGEVGELVVFQRTPAWLIPTPDYYADAPPELQWLFRHVPSYAQWYRFWLFWRNAEGMLPLVTVDDAWEPKDESVSPANELLRQFLLAYLDEQFGDDPELLAKVTPHYPPASKRVIRDDGTWARTLRRPNVVLETDPIEEITATGIRTAGGAHHEVDVIVYGTGFRASEFLTPMRVVGRDGVELHERWQGDARAHLGMTVPGFPNLFLLYGPNTNIVINGSIIYFSELEARYIVESVRMLAEHGAAAMDVRTDVHDEYNRAVDAGNARMAWGAASVNTWYKNASGRITQNWPFPLLEFWQRTRHPNPDDYHLA